MRFESLAMVGLVGWVGGCGDGGAKDRSAPCVDLDGDGFGEGEGCQGPDCNDDDEALRTQEECDAWCDANETAEGCPCNSLEPQICYDGAEETRGVGPCHAGLATCRSEGGRQVWGECEGQVIPQDETCDDDDDDCDGEIDDGTLSECGTCGECHRDCTGIDCQPWTTGESTGTVETAEGALELPMVDRERHVLWPYSANTGTVLRVNTETFEIEAAFQSGPNGAGGLLFGDAPAAAAVDRNGDVIVLNRAPLFGIPSMTKLAADPETCPDVNGDGVIQTSAAWNDALPFTADDAWEDECILFHRTFEAGSGPNGIVMHEELALDGTPTEYAWVALNGRQKYVQVDVETGDLTGVEAPTPGMSPEGGAVDADGWIWSKSLLGLFFGSSIGRFDTASPDDTFEVIAFAGILPLGLVTDENGTPWVAAANGLYQWDSGAASFNPVPIVADDGSAVVPMGLASDGAGSIWTAAGARGVFRVDIEDLGANAVETPGTDPQWMAADFDGHAWAFGSTTGNATVVDLDDEDTDVVLDDCDALPCLNVPQIAGDIAGVQSWTERSDAATWTKALQGCDIGVPTWRTLDVDALVPAETGVSAALRTADTLEGLAAATPVELGEIPDGGAVIDVRPAIEAAGVAHGPYAQVELLLTSEDGVTTPTLQKVELIWGCPDVFQ